MPQIIETTVYRLDELPDAVRETARAWFREGGYDYEWYDAAYEDFRRIAEILGIELKTRPVRLIGGGTRSDPCIWFTGFWSQGDGASFEGVWSYAPGAARHIRDYAPEDTELHRIADTLQAIQRRNFYQLKASVTQSGPYYHAYTMRLTVERDSPTGQDMTADAEDIVTECLRDLAHWLYRQLEREFDDLTSDAVVDEAILANDYTFTATGRRFG